MRQEGRLTVPTVPKSQVPLQVASTSLGEQLAPAARMGALEAWVMEMRSVPLTPAFSVQCVGISLVGLLASLFPSSQHLHLFGGEQPLSQG